MTKRTYYEWVIETVEGEDIVDVDFSDSFPFDLAQNSGIDIALRKTSCEWDSEVTKQEVDSGLVEPDKHDWFYAYLENGKLPEFFENNDRIPKRFHNEIEKEQG
jgi:hypothetical protein